ncbi:MAG: hypothetical protein AAFQ87_24995, partial [Bacteroidota bacterium]
MKKLIIYIVGTIALCLPLKAQVEMTLQQQAILHFQPEDLWVLTLHNLGSAQRVHLFAELRSAKDEVILQARSASMQLPTGRFQLQANQLLSRELNWLVETESLKGGNYQVCIQIITDDFSQKLGNACVFRQIQNLQPNPLGLSKPDASISFSGMARLEGQASNRQGFFQEIPANYLRFQLAPQINVMGVPLQGQLFLSTEQDGLRYDINTLGINFNRDARLRICACRASRLK